MRSTVTPTPHSDWIVVERSRGWAPIDLRELWSYRELLGFLVWREVTIRYRQTLLGALWAVLQPVLTMVVFTLVLGRLIQVPSDGIPYPIFAYAALLPWAFFASALSRGGHSLVGNRALVTNVYFPRLLIPLSATLTGLLDFAIAFSVLLVLMLGYGYAPSAGAWLLPVYASIALAASLGMALWLSAIQAEFRDVNHTVPLLTQIWLFATPVAYPASLVPEGWRTLYAANPMVSVVEGFRWALLGGPAPSFGATAVSLCVALALLLSGTLYFRRLERRFADVV